MGKKTIWLIVAVAVVILIVISAVKQPTGAQIKVGAIYALTGSASKYGELSARGAQDAVKYFEQKEKTTVKLFLGDNAGDPKQGVSAAQKMFGIDGVKFAVVGTSAVTNAVSPIADQYKTLLITDAGGYGLTKGRQYLFQNFLPSLNDVPKKINNTVEWKKVAVVYINDEFGNIWGNKILNALVGKDSKGFPFAKDTKDFRTDALKIKSFSPDVIFVLGYGPALNQVYADLSLQGVKTNMISHLSCTLPGVLADNRYSLDGTFSYEYPPVKNLELENWIKENGGDFNTFYTLAFENTLVALTAAKETSQDATKALDYLKLNNLSMLYGQVSFNAQNIAERDLEITKVVKGQCQLVSQ
jgi:ABC-type branched-subunit amino acid transport system substrate-binding protein